MLSQAMNALLIFTKPELFPWIYSPLANEYSDSTEIREEVRFHPVSPPICKFKGPGSLGSLGFSVFEHRNVKKWAPDLLLAFQTVCDPSSLLAISPTHPDPSCFQVCRTEQRRHFSYQEQACTAVPACSGLPSERSSKGQIERHELACCGCSASPLLPPSPPTKRSQKLWKYWILVLFIFKQGERSHGGKGCFGSQQSTAPCSDGKDSSSKQGQ